MFPRCKAILESGSNLSPSRDLHPVPIVVRDLPLLRALFSVARQEDDQVPGLPVLVKAKVRELDSRRVVVAALIDGEDRLPLEGKRLLLDLDDDQGRAGPVALRSLAAEGEVSHPVKPAVLDRAEESGAIGPGLDGLAAGHWKRRGGRPGLAAIP